MPSPATFIVPRRRSVRQGRTATTTERSVVEEAAEHASRPTRHDTASVVHGKSRDHFVTAQARPSSTSIASPATAMNSPRWSHVRIRLVSARCCSSPRRSHVVPLDRITWKLDRSRLDLRQDGERLYAHLVSRQLDPSFDVSAVRSKLDDLPRVLPQVAPSEAPTSILTTNQWATSSSKPSDHDESSLSTSTTPEEKHGPAFPTVTAKRAAVDAQPGGGASASGVLPSIEVEGAKTTHPSTAGTSSETSHHPRPQSTTEHNERLRYLRHLEFVGDAVPCSRRCSGRREPLATAHRHSGRHRPARGRWPFCARLVANDPGRRLIGHRVEEVARPDHDC